jgi:acetoin utilization deacetylase AcuC-like enzyme
MQHGKPLYLSHPASLEHDPRLLSPGHPDTPERLVVLEAALAGLDWLGWERRSAPLAREAQLELAHSPAHVRAVRELCEAGGGAIDPDTYVGPRSYVAARHAAGGAVEMARALLAGETSAGFCALRPSGHHAERDRAMGFCLFDSVAVAAAWALAEADLQRVFVLDWDVHHGNGTAEIFRTRSDVLFASLHQSPLYPGSGPLADAGSGAGEGYTINLPVPPGTGPELWMELFDRVLLPAAAAYEPQLILVSAGFDAHRADPLAHCLLATDTFVAMASRVRELSTRTGAPLGLVLEGGYHPGVLAECVCAILPVLAGEQGAAEHRPAGGEGTGDPIVARALEQVGRWWPAGGGLS